MSFVFGSIPNSLSFGSVKQRRLKYQPFIVTGSDVVTGTVTITVRSSNFSILKPEPYLGWVANTDGSVSLTVTVGPGAPLSRKLIVSFKAPTAGAPLPKFFITSNVPGSGSPEVSASAILPTFAQRQVSFIVDRSQSMGSILDGTSRRIDRALQAAQCCLDLMDDADLAELVTFTAAPAKPFNMAQLGPKGGGTRRAQLAGSFGDPTVSGTPNAATCIATAVLMAQAGSSKIVFSDCVEDVQPYVSVLLADSFRYAIGVPILGQAAFAVLSGGGNGGVGVTGGITGDTLFYVQKLAANVLLALANDQIVVDPEGSLRPGEALDFNFTTNELDDELKMVVFTEQPEEVTISVHPGSRYTGPERRREEGRYHRDDECTPEPRPVEIEITRRDTLLFGTLKVPAGLLADTGGQFHVRVRRLDAKSKDTAEQEPMPFSLLIAAQSDLVLDAALHSTSLRAGAELLLSATVTEASLPVEGRAQVEVELRYPDGGSGQITLEEGPPGRFWARVPTFRPGHYSAHFTATGTTLRGSSFRREWTWDSFLAPAGESCCPASNAPHVNHSRAT